MLKLALSTKAGETKTRNSDQSQDFTEELAVSRFKCIFHIQRGDSRHDPSLFITIIVRDRILNVTKGALRFEECIIRATTG